MPRRPAAWWFGIIAVTALLCFSSASRAADAPSCQPEKLATLYPSLVGKTIRIGQDGGSLPYSYHDPKDPEHIIGADADYARAVFKCIGVPVTFEIGAWSGLMPAVTAGRIDAMWDDLYYTPERAQRLDYIVYANASDVAVLHKGNPKHIESLNDLCGVRGVAGLGTVEALLLNSVSQKCTAAGKPPIQINLFQDRSTAWQMIDTNRADIVLSSAAMGKAAAADRPNALQTGFAFLPDVKVGVAVAKGNIELARAIANGMAATMATGEIAKIYVKYDLDPKLLLQPEILTK